MKERGLKDRDLVKLMYGDKSHQTFQTIFTKAFGVKKLIDACNALDIPMDSLFETVGETSDFPNITGNFNNVNSTVINSDITSLKSENETLKMLIKEKDARIEDLKKNIDKLIELIQFGQNLNKT